MKVLHREKPRLWKTAVILVTAAAAATVFLMTLLWSHQANTPEHVQRTSTPVAVNATADDGEPYETEKPLLDSYSVADDAPRALYIQRLSVAARIMPMGLTQQNAIQAPKNIHDAGWYTGSAKPNATGAMFIDGHASGASRLGLFAYLDTLQQGDEIIVEMGNGQKLTYVVRAVETVAKDKVNMAKALSPITKGANGLNLMTCTGSWVQDEETYDERVIVYTEQVS